MISTAAENESDAIGGIDNTVKHPTPQRTWTDGKFCFVIAVTEIRRFSCYCLVL